MSNKLIDNAFATLIENGYLTKGQAKKLLIKGIEKNMSFLSKPKVVPVAKLTAPAETVASKPKVNSQKFIDPDVRKYLASESNKPYTELTHEVMLELLAKKGVLKRTQKSIRESLNKEDVDDIQIQAELYKGIKHKHVQREKTDTDKRNGVYVYLLTNEGKTYLNKELL
tara:strand:+ start:13869 stop:14375 length:507 start_codon:yes stop_codon:yes gene_type:complete